MVSERRPHWDADLIEAVADAVDYTLLAGRMYNVIAVVEDWQAEHGINIVGTAIADHVTRLNRAESAIQRVREIHQPHRCRMSTRHIDCFIMFGGECSHEGKCQVCREKYPCATICALGGDGEPPQGPLQFYKGRSEGFTAIQTVGDAPGCPACDGVAGTECRCHLRTGCDLGTTRCHRAEAAEAVIERVRELCEQTTVSVSIGCRCYTDECSGTCGAGRPLSWHLNPAAVLAALDGDSDE